MERLINSKIQIEGQKKKRHKLSKEINEREKEKIIERQETEHGYVEYKY